jgi:hypothetical protein
LQRLAEIRAQIVDMIEPDRQSQQILRSSKNFASAIVFAEMDPHPARQHLNSAQRYPAIEGE